MAQKEGVENLADGSNGESGTAPLSRCKTLIYGLPGGALLPFTAMWSLYGNKYYEEFGANLGMIMLFTAVARSFDLIADPLMSYITDSSGVYPFTCGCFKRFGRRKPYMFIGAFMMGGCVWLLLNPPYASKTLLSMWFGFFYVSYYLWESITAIPYNAFGAELSESSDERTGAFFMEGLFEGIGTLTLVTAPIVFTFIFIPGYSDRNERICLPLDEMAAQCIAGKACTGVFENGWDAAYVLDESFRDNMLNAASKVAESTTIDYRRQCAAWSLVASRDDDAFKVITGTPNQNDLFCECFATCDKACNVAENRTAFMCVGYLFALYIIPTVWLSCCALRSVWDPAMHGTQKADQGSVEVKAPPLVPSLMTAWENRMFRVLLPSWTCDGLVEAVVMGLPYYYVVTVIAPAYMTMETHGVDCAASSPGYKNPDCGGPGGLCTGLASIEGIPEYNFICNTDLVIAFAGGSFLASAMFSVPLWYLFLGKVGKHIAWMLFSLAHGIATLGFLFLGEGDYIALFIVTALNGIPLGAKFLNDSILADIVDYDEFLTANRKEATYFMAKSFIPKVVQIPAAVLPIAFLPAVGYILPINGMVQHQPESVGIYIKFVALIGTIAGFAGFFLKFRYKLSNISGLQESLQNIKEGKEGVDPVSGILWKPVNIETRQAEERSVFFECSYFSQKSMREVLNGDKDTISRKVRNSFIISVAVFVACLVGVVSTLGFLDSTDKSFVPTLFMIGCGLMIAVNMYTGSRYFAAKRLLGKLEESQDLDSSCDSITSQITQESIQKYNDYADKKARLGRVDSSIDSISTTDTFEGNGKHVNNGGAPQQVLYAAPPATANQEKDITKKLKSEVEEMDIDFAAPPEDHQCPKINKSPVKGEAQADADPQAVPETAPKYANIYDKNDPEARRKEILAVQSLAHHYSTVVFPHLHGSGIQQSV